MNESKTPISSKGLQGSVVAGVIGLLALLRSFGVDIGFDQGQITEIIGAFAVIISAGVAFYGRWTATKFIK